MALNKTKVCTQGTSCWGILMISNNANDIYIYMNDALSVVLVVLLNK